MNKNVIIIGVIIFIATVSVVLYVLDDRTFQDRKFVYAAADILNPLITPNRSKGAAKVLIQLAEADHGTSQCFLGFLYRQDGAKNEDAERWLKKAAKNKCSIAPYLLGVYYKNHADTPENLKQALYWLTPIAEKGYDYAQYHLGSILIETSKSRAEEWLLRAAKQGNERAIQELKNNNRNYLKHQFGPPVYEHGLSKTDKDLIEYSPAAILLLLTKEMDNQFSLFSASNPQS